MINHLELACNFLYCLKSEGANCMGTYCSDYHLVKGRQKGVFPKTYIRNCDRLLIVINDWVLIKMNPQKKKMKSGGHSMGVYL